jgi:hypothetical protein
LDYKSGRGNRWYFVPSFVPEFFAYFLALVTIARCDRAIVLRRRKRSTYLIANSMEFFVVHLNLISLARAYPKPEEVIPFAISERSVGVSYSYAPNLANPLECNRSVRGIFLKERVLFVC